MISKMYIFAMFVSDGKVLFLWKIPKALPTQHNFVIFANLERNDLMSESRNPNIETIEIIVLLLFMPDPAFLSVFKFEHFKNALYIKMTKIMRIKANNDRKLPIQTDFRSYL